MEQVKSQFVEAMEGYWGYESFLPLQSEAMQAISDAQDSVVVLPTGGGKSLCYQAPAVTQEAVDGGGLAVGVSPLISLMKDQVDALRSLLQLPQGLFEAREALEVFEALVHAAGAAVEEVEQPDACAGGGRHHPKQIALTVGTMEYATNMKNIKII